MTAYPIPNAALDDRLAFLGIGGSGKTYNAGGAVERLLERKARVCIVDPLGVWWGLRLTSSGKEPSGFDVVIFGGPHGDFPLTEASGTLLGETVAGMAESCILDLSEIGTDAGERRFMLAFLTALYKHHSKSLLHLIIDEADMWAPQQIFDKEGEAAKLVGKMQTIVRRGRVRGFIPWLITQRPAVLSWGVLSQIVGIVAFTLTSSQDRDAIGRWVTGQADKARWLEIWAQLPELPVGRGLVWIPRRRAFGLADFPEKITFNSSRAPKRGEKRTSRKLKPLDLEKLNARMVTVEAEAKANDPTALRADLTKLKSEKAALERQIAAAAAKPAAAPAPDKDAIAAARQQGFDQAKRKLERANQRALHKSLKDTLIIVRNIAVGWREQLDRELEGITQRINQAEAEDVQLTPPSAPAPAMQQRPALTQRPAPAAPRTNGHAPAGEAMLAKGERAVLIAIAQHPNGVTSEQLTVLTGYKKTTRDVYIRKLVERGEAAKNGGLIVATAEGVSALGAAYEPLPTGDALREHALARLPAGERKLLEILCSAYPESTGRDELTEASGYKKTTRDVYIRKLAARELVSVAAGGAVRASDMLFG